MKKRLLFVINSLGYGGAEKALVSLLQTIDYSKYDVDLQLFKKEGVFLNDVPKKVKILPVPENYKYFDMSIKKAIFENLKKGKLNLIKNRILFGYVLKKENVRSIAEQKNWKYLNKAIKPLQTDYDVAIGFMQNTPNFFCIDKVNAIKKIAFIRNDYDKSGMNPDLDRPYFKKLTALLTVSKSCEAILQKHFSDLPIQIGTMQNVFSSKTIKVLSKQPITEDLSGISIVSIGRLHPQKGFELAIEACSLLIKKGYQVKWFILGDGVLRQQLQQQIDSLNISKNFFLIGQKENPYPYLLKAYIYAQTSRFEGKSRATEEAKILQKTILVTNFPTVSDQIIHLENGYIVELNASAIAEGIIQLIENKEIVEKLKFNLSIAKIDNKKELKVLYDIIEK